MQDLLGYWTDGAIHGGHSGWAFAFKADGTGFLEFTNFFLVNYSPMRWKVSSDRLEITADVEYSIDGSTRTFSPETYSYHATSPFRIVTEKEDGKALRVLTLDMEKADADETTKNYQPSEYGFVARLKVGNDYHPEQSRT